MFVGVAHSEAIISGTAISTTRERTVGGRGGDRRQRRMLGWLNVSPRPPAWS